MKFQAVCSCGWKGETRWAYELASIRATKHEMEHTDDPEGHKTNVKTTMRE